MKKFIKKNWIFLTALFAALVAIIILLFTGRPQVTYKLTTQEAVKTLVDSGNYVSPLEIFNQTGQGDQKTVLVDVRNTDDFAKGHIENAVNIPVLELFSKKSLTFFKELAEAKQPVVLYGGDQLQANGPWLLLRQAGFNEVKVMQGGYEFYKALPLSDSLIKARDLCYKAEISNIDTAEFNKKETAKPVITAPVEKKPKKAVPVQKVESSGGGC